MKIYLAGPMRGYEAFNHPAFHRAARLLRDEGHVVFSPAEHDNSVGLDTAGMAGDDAEYESLGFSLRSLLAADLAWICGEADALVMMPGWEASPGARAEAAVAGALTLPVWELARFLLYGSDAPAIKSAATRKAGLWLGSVLQRLAGVVAQPVAVSLPVAADLLGRLAQRLAHGLEAVALIEAAGHDQAEAGAGAETDQKGFGVGVFVVAVSFEKIGHSGHPSMMPRPVVASPYCHEF